MGTALLSELTTHNQDAVITELELEDSVKECLFDYGFVPGTPISFLAKAPFGGPISFRLRDSKIAIRHDIAAKIHIQFLS
ncbi:MAG: ferrous iron transport protein A [Candidatus Margulisbacteria bacterium]|nr:ferrous iron transport protein A [Candidatus Margulisiibacteriota bacterium]